MNYNIRIATEEELTKVYSLCKEVKHTYPYWDEYYPLYDDFLDTYDNGFVVLCEANNEIIGSICVEYDFQDVDGYEDCMSFSRFMVKESYRNQGIGHKLFEFSENIVKKEGYNKIAFLVHKDNTKALNLYIKWGYENKGLVKVCWDEVENEDYYLHFKKL